MASAGSAPAVSLKLQRHPNRGVVGKSGIRGVCPRGLIEAESIEFTNLRVVPDASAGSAPAASLKRLLAHVVFPFIMLSGIRGVCPRGLIEGRTRPPRSWSSPGIRGVCPRGLSEGPSVPATMTVRVGIRGVCPRGLIEGGRDGGAHREERAEHPRGLPPRPH